VTQSRKSPIRQVTTAGRRRHGHRRGTQREGLDVANPQPHVAQPRADRIRRGSRRCLPPSWEGRKARITCTHLESRALPAASPFPFGSDAHHPWSWSFSVSRSRIAPRQPEADTWRAPAVATRVLSTWHPVLAHAGHVPPASASPLQRIKCCRTQSSSSHRHTQQQANKSLPLIVLKRSSSLARRDHSFVRSTSLASTSFWFQLAMASRQEQASYHAGETKARAEVSFAHLAVCSTIL
jgi:hypothetical protein